MTKTYVITGATSGIGKALVESYKNEDVKLIIIARNLEKAQALKEVIDESKLEIVIADLENVDSLKDELKPGIIFTLKQIKEAKTKEQNVLAPYYMIHIAYDGEIKYSFMQSKKLMDFYKKLCVGKKEVLQGLVQQFNQETKDGNDMATYSRLLKSAIENTRVLWIFNNYLLFILRKRLYCLF